MLQYTDILNFHGGETKLTKNYLCQTEEGNEILRNLLQSRGLYYDINQIVFKPEDQTQDKKRIDIACYHRITGKVIAGMEFMSSLNEGALDLDHISRLTYWGIEKDCNDLYLIYNVCENDKRNYIMKTFPSLNIFGYRLLGEKNGSNLILHLLADIVPFDKQIRHALIDNNFNTSNLEDINDPKLNKLKEDGWCLDIYYKDTLTKRCGEGQEGNLFYNKPKDRELFHMGTWTLNPTTEHSKWKQYMTMANMWATIFPILEKEHKIHPKDIAEYLKECSRERKELELKYPFTTKLTDDETQPNCVSTGQTNNCKLGKGGAEHWAVPIPKNQPTHKQWYFSDNPGRSSWEAVTIKHLNNFFQEHSIPLRINSYTEE